jgi:hypothetical protein
VSTARAARSRSIPTGYRRAFAALPEHIQQRARLAYRQFRDAPSHPSLRFKPVHGSRPIYSARVGLGYRALAVRDGDTVVWFWIGTHADYDTLLRQL